MPDLDYETNKTDSGYNTYQHGCRFCSDNTLVIDYKNPQLLRHFITERGKIVSHRNTRTCVKHQRAIATAIKRARTLALMPFTAIGK